MSAYGTGYRDGSSFTARGGCKPNSRVYILIRMFHLVVSVMDALKSADRAIIRIRSKYEEAISRLQASLDSLSAKRERLRVLWRRTEELQKALAPDLFDPPEHAQLFMVLSEQQKILSMGSWLQELSSLLSVLDSPNLLAVPELSQRIQKISKLHLTQKEQSNHTFSEVKDQVENYNQLMELLSRQFVAWDAAVTQLEAAHAK
uniref:Dynactin subunit 3 n=1 Tax=Eptatretus burgeri TaxID=7764 RepID=A0A8C4QTC9_EPTBU